MEISTDKVDNLSVHTEPVETTLPSKPQKEEMIQIPESTENKLSVKQNAQKSERKLELTILVRDESIPVIDEESYKLAEYLLRKLGKELGVTSEI